MTDLEYGVDNGMGTVLLNRPAKKNAFNTVMLHECSEVTRGARADEPVGAIILAGAGNAFCSGGATAHYAHDQAYRLPIRA